MASLPLPTSLDPSLLPGLQARLRALPMLTNLGLDLLDLGPGWARVHVPAIPATVNLEGAVSGGILATAADVACALALSTAHGGDMPFATGDLHIRYLEPALGDVVAEARLIRHSSRSAVLECRLEGVDPTEAGPPGRSASSLGDEGTGGNLVALATCSFAVVRRREG